MQLVNHSKRLLKKKVPELKKMAVQKYLVILAENGVKMEMKRFVASAMEKILSSQSSMQLKIQANK